MTTLYLIVPCYNEEAVLDQTSKQLKQRLQSLQSAGRISEESRILFIDDGSRDRTWSIIENLCQMDHTFSGVRMSRNRGHQNALWCGLMTAMPLCDAAISIDADLQDDTNAIDLMLDRYESGCDVVYGVRSDRQSDSFLKRSTAVSFYRFMKRLGVDLVFNHADFRLMSRRAIAALSDFKEVNLFLRGLVPLVGFPSDVVSYRRMERAAGESKYSVAKMFSLALEGIVGFSAAPFRWIIAAGAGSTLMGLVLTILQFFRMASGAPAAGTAALIASLWIPAGMLLTAVGIVGMYTHHTLQETKGRPRYFVDRWIRDGREQPPHKQNRL